MPKGYLIGIRPQEVLHCLVLACVGREKRRERERREIRVGVGGEAMVEMLI